jgi:hypothetical protein
MLYCCCKIMIMPAQMLMQGSCIAPCRRSWLKPYPTPPSTLPRWPGPPSLK